MDNQGGSTAPKYHEDTFVGLLRELVLELESLNYSHFTISRTGKLHLVKSLPPNLSSEVPASCIPISVLEMRRRYCQGELTKSSEGAPRYYDAIKMLRRYRLIPPADIQGKLSPSEQKLRRRDYLREWRRRNSKPIHTIQKNLA